MALKDCFLSDSFDGALKRALQMMLNTSLTEFHRGWMIQIVCVGEGFQNIYHSPRGELLSDCELYPHQLKAWQAGIESIDYFFACHTIERVLRDAYEAEHLEFREWQSLRRSLHNEFLFSL